MKKQCWVYVDSGECVDAVTVEEAIAILSPRYRGETLTSKNVVEEATAKAMIRDGALPALSTWPEGGRLWTNPGSFEV